MILMSICVTGTAMEASAATATVNGKTFNVGDTIKYTVNVQFDKALEDFEANVFYSEEGLSLKVRDASKDPHDPLDGKYAVTLFEEKGNIVFNPENKIIFPGRSTVSYSGSSARAVYNYTTKFKLLEVYFVVEKAGNWTIENKFEVATAGSDGSKYASGGEVKNPFTNEQIVELAQPAPTPSTESSSQVSQKATVNGKTFNVGDTVTYTLKVQFPKLLEEFESDIFYSQEGLSLKVRNASNDPHDPLNGKYVITLFEERGNIVFNSENTVWYPGRSVITYSGSSARAVYDYRTQYKLLEAQFVVTKAGTWTIDNKFSTVTAGDSTKYVYKGEVVTPFTEIEEVTGSTPSTSESVPQTSSSSETSSNTSSSSAETSSSYTPIPGKTTFNGIECKVGDTATYYVYAQADKPIGSIQYEVDYGNQVTGNIDGLKLMDWSYVTLDTNTIVNPNIPGNFVYTVATSTNSYDFTKKTEMLKVNFKIEKEGTYFANGRWVTFVSDMDYPYIDGGQLFDNNYCKDTKTVINAQPPKTSSSSESTPPTSSSTAKPEPKTYTITKNLTNVTSTNGAATIKENEMYTTILAPVKGYEISSVTVTVGSQAYTPTKNADGTYTISVKATGNININAYAKAEETSSATTPLPAEYAVVVNAINAKSSNTATTVKAGTTYMTVIAPDSGYEISTIVASVGGQTINPIKNADGTYTVTTIASGDIIVNVVATKKDVPITETFTITNSLTNVVSSNTQTTIKKGETYNTTLVPQEGYTIQSVVVTVGSTQITPVKNGNMYIVTAPATGNIVVVAVATKNDTIPTPPQSSSSSSSETSSESSSSSQPQTSETIPSTSSGQVITINKMMLNNTNLVVSEGTKVDLIASIWPGYTTQKTVTWSVTNSRVGVCSQTKSTKTGLYDNDGKLFCTETATFTAKDDGQTVVKAISDTGLVAKCVITVKPVATSIKLNRSSATIYTGKYTTLKATVGPSNIASTYKRVTWSTSNKKVATVTSAGKVVARGKGTCVITARSADNTALTAKCKITVKQRVTSIKFSKSRVTLAKKNKYAIVKVYAYPSNANDKRMLVKSENTRIARVNRSAMTSGQSLKITAVKKGTTYVRATARDGSKKYARCRVVVKK